MNIADEICGDHDACAVHLPLGWEHHRGVARYTVSRPLLPQDLGSAQGSTDLERCDPIRRALPRGMRGLSQPWRAGRTRSETEKVDEPSVPRRDVEAGQEQGAVPPGLGNVNAYGSEGPSAPQDITLTGPHGYEPVFVLEKRREKGNESWVFRDPGVQTGQCSIPCNFSRFSYADVRDIYLETRRSIGASMLPSSKVMTLLWLYHSPWSRSWRTSTST